MTNCPPDEISLKSYFLGPQAENTDFLKSAFLELIRQYCDWRQSLFPYDSVAISKADQNQRLFQKNQKTLQALAKKLSLEFQREIPQFSPRYLGHMFSELSLPGLLGHTVAVFHNPNNISKESSQVGLKIEAEAIQALCQMLGLKKGIGHFTSGGTVANLEALLRMRARLPPSKWLQMKLLTSTAAHYSWKKNLKILGLPESALIEVPLDSEGRMSLPEFEKALRRTKSNVVAVVSLYGSTERGTIDDISRINQIIRKFPRQNIWHHVDAAYGGFFACVDHAKGSFLKKQTKALSQVDSLTLDPHKLGYVPYGCGAFLCRHQKDYFYNEIEAPYIQFKSAQEAGVQSVEGSRPATGAAATWLTAQSLGFHGQGLGKVLERQLKAKKRMQSDLQRKLKTIFFAEGLDLNILCWTLKTKSQKLSDSNLLVDDIFEKLPQLERPYFVSKTSLPLEKNNWLKDRLGKAGFQMDSGHCHLIRMTLMNPFLKTRETQTDFIQDFVSILSEKLESP